MTDLRKQSGDANTWAAVVSRALEIATASWVNLLRISILLILIALLAAAWHYIEVFPATFR